MNSSYLPVGSHQVLSHGDSDYVREFGITVDQAAISVGARQLDPPVLLYRPAPENQEERVVCITFYIAYAVLTFVRSP